MGCTSSAPISDFHSHTTENDKTETNDEKNDKENVNLEKDVIKKEEKPVQTDFDDLECNVIKMLPQCDNLDQNIQLDRSSNSPPDDVTTEESDVTDVNGGEGNEIKVIEETIPDDPGDQMQKSTKFQEFVDQVVLDSILEDMAKMPGLKDEDDKVESETIDESNEINKSNEELEAINDDEEHPEEAASPSQSECSRATRWEALADIAAELPPSLAVDPLTGQIFSLSK